MPILFAHRGGKAHAPENSIEAFVNALAMGIGGLESDIWSSRDNAVVLSHSPLIRRFGLPFPIAFLPRSTIPGRIPTLDALYAIAGTDFELSLDVKQPSAGVEAIAIATEAGGSSRLWLCSADRRRLSMWRLSSKEIRLVDSTRLALIRGGRRGVAARAEELAERGIDALNLHGREWNREMVEAVHTAGILAFGWDAHTRDHVKRLVDLGVDGIYGDDVEVLLESGTG